MSIVHSVSDITSILSGITQNESQLHDIWVQGEVEALADGPSSAFYLRNESNKLRCFIPGGKIPNFKPLLKQGNTVVVNGKIALFSSFSQYQILVSNISKPGFPSISVSKITTNLQSIIETADSLKNIHVQGKISDINMLEVCDAVGTGSEGLPRIKFFPLDVPMKLGDEVCLRGKISIYPQKSLYQIDVNSMELVPYGDNKARCQCPGCEQCLPVLGSNLFCNRPRNSPDHVLCATCYQESPNREDLVKDAVYAYFDRLKVNGFSPVRESQIQFGSRNGKADVVLADGNGSFAAIVECKGSGTIGHGIEQLKSYLCATDTRFGIFANSTDSDPWIFYENLRHNCFREIDRSEFEEGVIEGIATRDRLSDEIEVLESKFNQLKSEIDALKSKKVGIETEVRQENLKLDVLRQAIETDQVDKQDSSNEIDRLRTDKAKLENEIGHLGRKERKLQASLEQWKEKIQQFETFLADMKSDLLDSELLSQSEENADPQKTHGKKKQAITNWFKNRFSKENE